MCLGVAPFTTPPAVRSFRLDRVPFFEWPVRTVVLTLVRVHVRLRWRFWCLQPLPSPPRPSLGAGWLLRQRPSNGRHHGAWCRKFSLRGLLGMRNGRPAQRALCAHLLLLAMGLWCSPRLLQGCATATYGSAIVSGPTVRSRLRGRRLAYYLSLATSALFLVNSH